MYTDILVLTQLLAEPGHGYEIKKRVERALAARGGINDNSLYPLLRRFQNAGYVSTRRENGARPGGPQKNVFALTDQGLGFLRERLRDFPPELAQSGEEFYIRVAFMDLLSVADRARIFAARREHLQTRLTQMRAWEEGAGETAGRYGRDVIHLQIVLATAEIEWIDAMVADLQQEELKGGEKATSL